MRDWLWSCRSSATSSPTIQPHSSSRLPVSPRRRSAAARLVPHQRTRTHLATTLQLHSRWCAHPTAMWQDRLAMWSPSGDADQLETGQAVDAGAQIRPHHTSQRRHRTHRVVRPHAEDTPRLYARRLRGRVFKRSPVLFVVTPLSAKTICPSGNCSPMAFWSNMSHCATGQRTAQCSRSCHQTRPFWRCTLSERPR